MSIRFKVNEVVKGQDLPQELVINGYLTDFDDFNDRSVPYDFVRPGGRHGNCTAYEYKRGAEFLLFLKKSEGKLSPYWDALSPTNEQLHSKTDPWISWVKERLKTLEKEKGENKSLMLFPEIIKIAFRWWLGRQIAFLTPGALYPFERTGIDMTIIDQCGLPKKEHATRSDERELSVRQAQPSVPAHRKLTIGLVCGNRLWR